MRKPIKPFAVETRRAGRKPPPQKTAGEDEAPKPAQPEWPPLFDEEETYAAAMRAADALFTRSAPEPAPEDAPTAAPSEAPRRILQSLNEDDHIARLLAEEDEHRPRRGRKPRDPSDPAPHRPARGYEAPGEVVRAPQLATAEAEGAGSDGIPGYVRGQIYGRYARHDQTRPGEQWRKRTLKPLW